MRSLMAKLRPKAPDAGALYGSVVGEARRPAWYREGGVEDSLDGRFAVLSSLTALTILRLEDGEELVARFDHVTLHVARPAELDEHVVVGVEVRAVRQRAGAGRACVASLGAPRASARRSSTRSASWISSPPLRSCWPSSATPST